jgi:hypothetical protein
MRAVSTKEEREGEQKMVGSHGCEVVLIARVMPALRLAVVGRNDGRGGGKGKPGRVDCEGGNSELRRPLCSRLFDKGWEGWCRGQPIRGRGARKHKQTRCCGAAAPPLLLQPPTQPWLFFLFHTRTHTTTHNSITVPDAIPTPPTPGDARQDRWGLCPPQRLSVSTGEHCKIGEE